MTDEFAIQRLKDRKALYKRLPKGGIVAEVGVGRGENARDIYRIARPSQLHLIDPFMFYWMGDSRGKWRKVPGVTLVETTSEEAAEKFPDQFFDWVYIDADHRYEGVRGDIDFYLPKVKIGGYLCGHDCFNNGPRMRYSMNGVVTAVLETLNRGDVRMRFVTCEPSNGSFAMVRLA